jgi:tetratricopeptide (TPR) repeat protein
MVNSFLSRENPNFNRNVIIVVAAILFLAATNFLVRTLIDSLHYDAGLQAYVDFDCKTAMSHFDKVIQSKRNNDFGGLKAMALVRWEDCELFQPGVAAQQAGKPNMAISAYLYYIDRTATGQFSNLSQNLIINILSTSTLEELISGGVCLELGNVAGARIFPPDDPVLPFIIMQCGNSYRNDQDFQSAITIYQFIPEYYQDKDLIANARNEVFNTRFIQAQFLEKAGKLEEALEIYEMLLEIRPTSGKLHHAIATVFFKQATTHAQNGNHGKAITLYERIKNEFPDVDFIKQVEEELARSLVADARSSGARNLTPPEKSGNSKAGTTSINIRNDTPHTLRIVFSGPDTLIEELEACTDCQVYTAGSLQLCPGKGPLDRFTFTPGEYDVLVESLTDSSVIPWTGTWNLANGAEYSDCYVIEREILP